MLAMDMDGGAVDEAVVYGVAVAGLSPVAQGVAAYAKDVCDGGAAVRLDPKHTDAVAQLVMDGLEDARLMQGKALLVLSGGEAEENGFARGEGVEEVDGVAVDVVGVDVAAEIQPMRVLGGSKIGREQKRK